MSSTTRTQINNTIGVFPKKSYSGIDSRKILISEGSRIVLTLDISQIDIGASVVINIKNRFSEDQVGYELTSFNENSIGTFKRVLSDFHNLFDVELEVSGGSAILTFGLSTHDNATKVDENGLIPISSTLDDLNKLIPQQYDDAEVMAETAGKQPTIIEFRKDGSTIRTIQIDYVNEVFKRVRKI
jgi:hypothetical protein